MKRFCNRCGAERTSGDSQFCAKCGAAFTDSVADHEPSRSGIVGTIWRSVMGWSWRRKALAGGLLVLVFLMILGAALGDDGGETGTTASERPTADAAAGADARATARAQRIAADARATDTAERVAAFIEERATSRPPGTPRPTPEPDYQLALVSASCTLRADIGFTECEGFVKNISGTALNNIMVVVTWYDENDVPQSIDDALIDFRPVLNEQLSPWNTIGTYNPALSGFVVQFKEFSGGTILTRDDR